MARRWGGALFAGLLGLGLSGCVLLPERGPEAVQSPESRAAAPTELPPEKAAEVCLAAAREMEKHGRTADAILRYEKARHLNPRLTHVSRRLAVLYDRQGDYERAEAEYRLALQHYPRDPDLLNDVGYFHYQRGNWEEAERRLRQALAIDSKHQRAWVNLGLTLGQQGRDRESYEAFARVVSPARAHSNLGILLAQQGRTADAMRELRQALELEPDLKPARVVHDRLEKGDALSATPSNCSRTPSDAASGERALGRFPEDVTP